MKPTLQWRDRECTNPPDGWYISIGSGCESKPPWNWSAYRGRTPTNLRRTNYDDDGYPTAKAAQLACEAALWRLGVLPLPAWELANPNYVSDSRERLLDVDAPAYAMVGHCVDLWSGWYAGEVRSRDALPVKIGPSTELSEVKRAAETHLRAAIAAALEAA